MHANEFCLPDMSNCDPEELFVCPYDKVHRISAKRWPYHMKKCRKNHRGAPVDCCPFNARHIIPISELRHHVATCPDRNTIEPDIAHAEAQKNPDANYLKGDTSVPSYHHDVPLHSSENWDLEVPHQRRTYPEGAQAGGDHTVVGMTTAQKTELARKLLEVNKNNDRGEDSEEEEPQQPESNTGEMRRPKQLPKAAIALEHHSHNAHNGMVNSVGQEVPHRLMGFGRGTLVPKSQSAIPRHTTTVQGRTIAANIFNSPETEQNVRPAGVQGSVQPPTVAMASSNTLAYTPRAPTQNPTQNGLSNNPQVGPMVNLTGLGRGRGVPRGGYRPGLGMPAAGLQSSQQAPNHPGMQQ